jgi:predicted small lipoprotein YifL
MWKHRARVGWLILTLALTLAGCGGGKGESAIPPAETFPAADDVPGWTPEGDPRTFDEETLFDLVDGQADAFFAYGFERVATRRYTGAGEAMLHVEVWQLATPANAYGLFSANVAGTPVAGIGAGGDADPGRRLTFWQDRYFVNVYAFQETTHADLEAIARSIGAALPPGGEPPALVDRLPPDGLIAHSPRFFHQEISIQDVVWLGGENVLGLSFETDGVLARYELGESAAWLMLIAYPTPSEATDARGALDGAGVENLVAAEVDGNRLGAVFGQIDATAAGELLAQALGGD